MHSLRTWTTHFRSKVRKWILLFLIIKKDLQGTLTKCLPFKTTQEASHKSVRTIRIIWTPISSEIKRNMKILRCWIRATHLAPTPQHPVLWYETKTMRIALNLAKKAPASHHSISKEAISIQCIHCFRTRQKDIPTASQFREAFMVRILFNKKTWEWSRLELIYILPSKMLSRTTTSPTAYIQQTTLLTIGGQYLLTKIYKTKQWVLIPWRPIRHRSSLIL